ncbi:MAG: NAD-dependent succinate-semialdehyde dehydrogenase [Bacteroidia bacterium]
MPITSYNPATGKEIKSYQTHSAEEVEAKLRLSEKTFTQWRRSDVASRARLMRAAAEVLRQNKSRYAARMTEEMGKLAREGEGEIEKCAWVCDYYAEHAEAFLAEEPISTDASYSSVVYQPIGPVLAVMPWNFPFWQVFRFAAPNLMAGNVGLLKHASNVPGCALDIEEVFREAGFPAGCFQTLLIGSDRVEDVIRHDAVKAVTLTGSTPAGRAVAAVAGQALKKTVLELGGSDPYVILEDADLDLAVEKCATSRMINSGQSCIAAKRFIVVEEVYDTFVEKFRQRLAEFETGDPSNPKTKLGPQARQDLRNELHMQVQKSVEAGAEVVLGGAVPESEGAFYPATMLIHVEKGMPAWEEELFGPVASVIRAKDEKDAILIANDTNFGLGAAVFTRDVARGRRIAAFELEAGCCFVNDFVRSDPRLPFGGIKTSGYGRELARHGIREFVNAKTVYVS